MLLFFRSSVHTYLLLSSVSEPGVLGVLGVVEGVVGGGGVGVGIIVWVSALSSSNIWSRTWGESSALGGDTVSPDAF